MIRYFAAMLLFIFNWHEAALHSKYSTVKRCSWAGGCAEERLQLEVQVRSPDGSVTAGSVWTCCPNNLEQYQLCEVMQQIISLYQSTDLCVLTLSSIVTWLKKKIIKVLVSCSGKFLFFNLMFYKKLMKLNLKCFSYFRLRQQFSLWAALPLSRLTTELSLPSSIQLHYSIVQARCCVQWCFCVYSEYFNVDLICCCTVWMV